MSEKVYLTIYLYTHITEDHFLIESLLTDARFKRVIQWPVRIFQTHDENMLLMPEEAAVVSFLGGQIRRMPILYIKLPSYESNIRIPKCMLELARTINNNSRIADIMCTNDALF